MNDLDALIAANAVTDPAEVHENNIKSKEEIDEYLGKNQNTNTSSTTHDNGKDGDKKDGQN